jgi:cytochrome P450
MARLLIEPALIENPHPFYDELRAAGPLVSGRIATVTARHDVISEILTDPSFLSGPPTETMPAPLRRLSEWSQEPGIGNPINPPSMIVTNGPEHDAYRRLAMKAFTARAIERLRENVARMTDELLDQMAARLERGEPADVVADLADILPVLVIAEVLGVPGHMQPQFRAWATEIAVSADLGMTYRKFAAGERAMRSLAAWMSGHLSKLRAAPEDTLLGRMVQAADAETSNGVRITDEGLMANSALLLLAGFETTVNLIGNGAQLLMRNPEQLAVLQERPELWGNAVEETLRYASPLQNTFRFRATDGELHGVPLPRGVFLSLILAGANRDPAVFDDPHRFDVARPNAREHLAFAVGPHFCVGAALARMEGEIVLRKLFERFPQLTIAGEPQRRPTRVLMGLAKLPVRLQRSSVVA